MKYLFISNLIVFHGFVIFWIMANSLNLFQKRTWDSWNIYDGALIKIVVDSRNPLTIVITSSILDAAGILGPTFSFWSWWQNNYNYTLFFIKQHFFQLTLSVAYLFHELSFRCCLRAVVIIFNHWFFFFREKREKVCSALLFLAEKVIC